jgi:S-adenosylmethionine hydrolase
VIRVDHFGNLITNIDDEELAALGTAVSIDIAGATIDGMAGNYADVAHGALCAVIGSTGRLEISVNGGSAARSSERHSRDLRARAAALGRVIRFRHFHDRLRPL